MNIKDSFNINSEVTKIFIKNIFYHLPFFPLIPCKFATKYTSKIIQ